MIKSTAAFYEDWDRLVSRFHANSPYKLQKTIRDIFSHARDELEADLKFHGAMKDD